VVQNRKNVVVGAGLNGLVLARVMQQRSALPVVLLDSAASIGGLFQSCSYPGFGTYDHGVHIFQDTGVEEIEEIIRSSLGDKDWQDLRGFKREIAGLYFNGNLQTNTAFLDLRHHEDRDVLFGGMLESLNQRSLSDPTEMSFSKMIAGKFGTQILRNVIGPIVEGIYGHPVENLQKLAATLTPFHRVVLFDEDNMPDLMQSESIRARLGYPEQKNLPDQYSSGLKSYYPKEFGLQKVIDNLAASILAAGGEIRLNAKISNIETASNRAEAIVFEQDGTRHHLNNINQCMWTASLPSLFFALGGEKIGPIESDPPPQTWILNLACTQKPNMADLYFFYSYLQKGNAFRISNPLNYSESFVYAHDKYFPLCVEAVFSADNKMSSADMTNKLINELVQMGIVSTDTVVFSDLKRLPAGFPMPTLRNAHAITNMRNFISEKNLKNIIPVGIQAEPDLFYYRDILRYSHKKFTEVDGN
jgi:protoporphyrinogen oxidase